MIPVALDSRAMRTYESPMPFCRKIQSPLLWLVLDGTLPDPPPVTTTILPSVGKSTAIISLTIHEVGVSDSNVDVNEFLTFECKNIALADRGIRLAGTT